MNRRASVLVLLLATAPVHAREVDQFTDRPWAFAHLADASAVLDAQMNVLLRQLEAALVAHADDRDQLVYDTFVGSRIEAIAQLRTPFETWVGDTADVTLFWVDQRGMYGGSVDYDDMGLAWYIDNAPLLRIGPVVVGLDKLGHFVGQGWFYYREFLAAQRNAPTASEPELLQRVAKYGHGLELGYQGFTGTGVYSFADLAANASGLAFYRALFAGPAPYFVLEKGRYRLAREFHFADYVTDAWDEGQNPSLPRSRAFYDKVATYLRMHVCDAYLADPVGFVHASGRTQDPAGYEWNGATTLEPRLALDKICRG